VLDEANLRRQSEFRSIRPGRQRSLAHKSDYWVKSSAKAVN